MTFYVKQHHSNKSRNNLGIRRRYLIMNNSPKYSTTCIFLLTDLKKESQDIEEAFRTRLAFFQKVISEKGIY